MMSDMDVSKALIALYKINEIEVTLNVTVNSLAFSRTPFSGLALSVTEQWAGAPTQQFLAVIKEGSKAIAHGRANSVEDAIQDALTNAQAWVRGELSMRENNAKEFRAKAEAALAEMSAT